MLKSQTWQVPYHLAKYRARMQSAAQRVDSERATMLKMIQESLQVSDDVSDLEKMLPEGFTVLRPVEVYGLACKPGTSLNFAQRALPSMDYGFGVNLYLCFNGTPLKDFEETARRIPVIETELKSGLMSLEQKYDLWQVKLACQSVNYD